MVNIVVQFINAERTADQDFHLTTVAAMVPHFLEMDRQSYARWLPIYLADMNSLAAAHSRVYEEFMSGGHAVSRSSHPFLDRHGVRARRGRHRWHISDLHDP